MSDRKPTGFFRRGGKIIPIFRTKKQRNDFLKGSALLTAGISTATVGSYAAGRQIQKARQLRLFGEIGKHNIIASGSKTVNLSSFRLSAMEGRIKKMRGPRPKVDPHQLSLFGSTVGKKSAGKAFSLGKRVRAYRSAFIARKALKYSTSLSHAAVGLGVDKLIEATGIEANLGNEYISEVAGVLTFGATEAVSRNVYRKVGYGESLRKGLKKDALKGLKKYSGTIRRFGMKIIKRKVGL